MNDLKTNLKINDEKIKVNEFSTFTIGFRNVSISNFSFLINRYSNTTLIKCFSNNFL